MNHEANFTWTSNKAIKDTSRSCSDTKEGDPNPSGPLPSQGDLFSIYQFYKCLKGAVKQHAGIPLTNADVELNAEDQSSLMETFSLLVLTNNSESQTKDPRSDIDTSALSLYCLTSLKNGF